MSTDRVAILGAGGHAAVLAEILREAGVEIAGVVAPDAPGPRLADVPWLGDDSILADLPAEVLLVNGVGSTTAAGRRAAAFDAGRAAGRSFRSVIHPAAVVAASARLGEGVQILAGAIVSSGVVLEDDVLVNSGAIVDHDSVVGAHAHIATGAALAGAARVGAGSHVGLGARVLQGVTLGSTCTIGAGAVVLTDVPDGATAVGVPAVARVG